MEGPWHIDIRPWQSWVQRSAGTWTVAQQSSLLGGGKIYSTTIGNVIGWDVPLTAGTWSITTIYEGDGSADDATAVKLGATTVGTINQRVGTTNSVSTIAGVVVTADGVVRLTYTHGNSSWMQLQHIALSRTA